MKRKGPWSADEVERFLSETRVPMRLSCLGESGFPVLASLWFVPEEGAIWCATQRAARVAVLLERDARCAFEIARDDPPYRGVRGQATARVVPERGEEMLRLAIERYLGDTRPGFARWLLSRAETETAIAIEPRQLLSWDFRERMGGSG